MIKKQYKINSTYNEVTRLNLEIKDLYYFINLDEQQINELEIVFIESMNNIVKHSYLAKPDGIIHVEIIIQNHNWECILRDFGISRSVFEIPDLNFNPDDIQNLPEGGMGLFLINKLTDFNEYKIFDTHNEFYLQKKIQVKLQH
jgi:serine/threonine-protein kinase RsbW